MDAVGLRGACAGTDLHADDRGVVEVAASSPVSGPAPPDRRRPANAAPPRRRASPARARRETAMSSAAGGVREWESSTSCRLLDCPSPPPPASFVGVRRSAHADRGATFAAVRLEGENALVTGSTAGIGKADRDRVRDRGAARRRNRPRPRRAARPSSAAIAEAGGEAVFVAADLADEAACAQLVDARRRGARRLTVLVNNAVARRSTRRRSGRRSSRRAPGRRACG